MTTSTHRHPKWGEGQIVGWFEEDMVMFKSNHGKTMLREATLTPLSQTPPPMIQVSSTPAPELQAPKTFAPPPVTIAAPPQVEIKVEPAKNPRQRKKVQTLEAESKLVNLNKVTAFTEISDAFPRLGKIGAKKLFDKTPSSGWVSLNSVREFCGDLFPTQESWEAFSQLFEVS